MLSSSLCNELNEVTNVCTANSQGDERSLQFALELSHLGMLGNCEDCNASNYDDVAKKKSQNMTECVPVPSSEHVAEIVGRQGCKIKALRAKTNTYIKTPVRGEEPVFVVTGRKEDVAMARREVQSAAEHFTQIRASRNRHGMLNGQGLGVDGENTVPGTITLQVRVPYRVVGLVVGPKGATIKRIQQQTHTYIVTPSRDREPVFEVTGLPENVERAKEEIEVHIASRTGTQQTNIDEDFKNNGTEVGSPSVSYITKAPTPITTLYKQNQTTAAATFLPNSSVTTGGSMLRSQAPNFYPSGLRTTGSDCISNLLLQPKLSMYQDRIDPNTISSLVSACDINENARKTPRMTSVFSSSDLGDWSYKGCRKQYGSGSSSASSSVQPSRTSPTLSENDYIGYQSSLSSRGLLLPISRVGSDSNESTTSSIPVVQRSTSSIDLASIASALPGQSGVPNFNIESGYSSGGTSDSVASGSPVESAFPQAMQQRCLICNEGSVVAALVPCGHNLFCYSCASGVATTPGSVCPCCQQPASLAIVIKGK